MTEDSKTFYSEPKPLGNKMFQRAKELEEADWRDIEYWHRVASRMENYGEWDSVDYPPYFIKPLQYYRVKEKPPEPVVRFFNVYEADGYVTREIADAKKSEYHKRIGVIKSTFENGRYSIHQMPEGMPGDI